MDENIVTANFTTKDLNVFTTANADVYTVRVSESDYNEPWDLTYQQRKILNFMLLIRESAKEDTNYIYTVDSNGDATLIMYLGEYTDIITPTKIDGHDVKYIASTCYNYNENVRSVIVSEGVVSIG